MNEKKQDFVFKEIAVSLPPLETSVVLPLCKKFVLRVEGLKGGDPLSLPEEKRGNAIEIANALLAVVFIKTDLRLVSIFSDGAHDAVPSSAEAVFFVPAEQSKEALRIIKNAQTEVKKKYDEPTLSITVLPCTEQKNERAFSEESESRLIGFLMQLKSGFVSGLSEKACVNLFAVLKNGDDVVIKISVFGKDRAELRKVRNTLQFCFERAHVSFVE
jgi:hypothetical protein